MEFSLKLQSWCCTLPAACLPCPTLCWHWDVLHTRRKCGVMVTSQGTPWGKSPPGAKGYPLGIGTASRWWTSVPLAVPKPWLSPGSSGWVAWEWFCSEKDAMKGCVWGAQGQGGPLVCPWKQHSATWHLGYSVLAAAWLHFGRVSITPWHGHHIPLWASHSSMGIAPFHRHCTLPWVLRAIAGIPSPCGHCTLAWALHPIAGIALYALHPIAGIAPHCGHHTPL